MHAIKVKGKTVLVVMDFQTRFSITLTALKKGDDSAFLNAFELHLRVHVDEMMASINIDPQIIVTSFERYCQQQNSRALYLRGDRSVQAHINDVAWHFRGWVDEIGEVPTGVDLIGLDVFVNGLLRRHKDGKTYFTPQHEFLRAWLKQYGEYSTAQADACIDSLNAKERADFDVRHPNLIPLTEPSDTSNLKRDHATPSNNVIALDAYRKK